MALIKKIQIKKMKIKKEENENSNKGENDKKIIITRESKEMYLKGKILDATNIDR